MMLIANQLIQFCYISSRLILRPVAYWKDYWLWKKTCEGLKFLDAISYMTLGNLFNLFESQFIHG